MGLSKALGGMGFRDFTSFSKTLLAKQSWRLHNQPDSLVAKIMKDEYYPYNTILEARVGGLLLQGGASIDLVTC